MNKYAVIVAGGVGSRMQSDVPKQFMLLNGLPVLMHSIQQFYACKAQIVVALAADLQLTWQQLCKQYNFEIPHQVIAGGQWRAQSVHNGLQHWAACTGIVAVHDAARPLATKALITLLYNEAEIYGNAIPFLPLTESIRQTDGNINRAVNRNHYVAVQTPQCFDLQKLLSAYNEVVNYDFTDEASLFEKKEAIHLVAGQSNNLKITKPGDIAWAEQLLQQQNI